MLEISWFYTCAPKIMTTWCTVPEIWCTMDGWTDGRLDRQTDWWIEGQTDQQKKWHIEVGAQPKKKLKRIYLFRCIFFAFALKSTVFCNWLFAWSFFRRTLCSLCDTTFEERTNVSLKVKKSKSKSHSYSENDTVCRDIDSYLFLVF